MLANGRSLSSVPGLFAIEQLLRPAARGPGLALAAAFGPGLAAEAIGLTFGA